MYVAELRHLSNHCDFGPALNEVLHDRMVCSIEESKIHRRLLAETDLTFDKAFEFAVASEFANKNAKDLQTTKLPQKSVYRVQSKQIKPCYVPLHRKYKTADCQFKSTECHKCDI